MKAVPVEKINQIIDSTKSELVIELLRAIVETHAVEVNDSDFINLVERIRAIDPKAADWIIENQDIFQMNKKNKYLHELFIWQDTPQGQSYWNEISIKLGEQQ